MDINARKGGGAALPPLHSTTIIASEIGKLKLDSKKKKGWANGHECPQRRENHSSAFAFDHEHW